MRKIMEKEKKTVKSKKSSISKEKPLFSDKNRKISKTDNILCIVESPNKKSTISKIFKDAGYLHVDVEASVGHITQIGNGGPYWNTGIFPEENFKINNNIIPSKTEIVKKLKDLYQKTDFVLLATDEDREGESISASLKEKIKIKDCDYSRITFHEITQNAVIASLSSPRKIDEDLVKAARARSIVDKLMGYRLSPIANSQLGARSVGRCQSAGLLMAVEREEEIKNFIPEEYFDLFLFFSKNFREYSAKYIGTPQKVVSRIPDKKTCDDIKDSCAGKPYFIDNIEFKTVKESPKPPFTTSTFQQDANRILGLPIDIAMKCAQKLFEGIEINGEHVALITYIRTDDSSMSPDFAETLGDYVEKSYGSKYKSTVKQAAKSNASVQEAHECLRIINLEMPPERLSSFVKDNNLRRVYRLIWERTIMSSMVPAVISDTCYNIRNGVNVFAMHSRELIFDGYRRGRSKENDEEGEMKDAASNSEILGDTFCEGEVLKNTRLQDEKKQTLPPARYTEASFIKELDKRGIGRPSTFVTILKTILDESRGYCCLENKFIVPTEKGIALSHFLKESFPDLINLNYTCELEKSLDLIAKGKLHQIDFLNQFLDDLEKSAKKVESSPSYSKGQRCPLCGRPLVRRHSRFGFFLGCSGYPQCKYILGQLGQPKEKIKKDSGE